MMGIRVDQHIFGGHDPDMSFPKDQITTQEGFAMMQLTPQFTLLVTVAGASDAAGQQGLLHKPRTIDTPA